MLDLLLHDLYFSFIGYSLVFVVLLSLCVLVAIIKYIDSKLESVGKKKVKLSTEHQDVDDTTMLLITTAVATYFKGGAYVKRVRVLPGGIRSGSWSTQGRASVQGSHEVRK